MKNLKVVLGCALALSLFGVSVLVNNANQVSANDAITRVVITADENSCAWASGTRFDFGTATVSSSVQVKNATGMLVEEWLGSQIENNCKLSWTDLTGQTLNTNVIPGTGIEAKEAAIRIISGAPVNTVASTITTFTANNPLVVYTLQANTAGTTEQDIELKLSIPEYTPADTYEGRITATRE